MRLSKSLCWLIVGLLAGFSFSGQAREGDPVNRWIFCRFNLEKEENVQKMQDLCHRGAAAGYTGLVLADSKFIILGQMDKKYFDNVAAVKKTAEQMGLELIPCVMPIGYSNRLLEHDPNLAEGLPVRDALFVVEEDQAHLVADPSVELKNGDFEVVNNFHHFSEWKQDGPGKITFADTKVVHHGSTSLRVEHISKEDPEHGQARIWQDIPVAPFRCYHLSVWIKTESFESNSKVRVAVADFTLSKELTYHDLGVQKNQGWTEHDIVFNSLSNKQVRIYLGVWKGKGGKFWWDHAQLEEVGFLNVLRRPGCPLTVRSEDGTIYYRASA